MTASIFDAADKIIAKAAAAQDATLKLAVEELSREGIKRSSVADLLANVKPASWCVKNILIDGYVYALTAGTGTGKTTLLATLAVCVAFGVPFAGNKVREGRVLYLAGENPEDVLFKIVAAMHELLPSLGTLDQLCDMVRDRIDIIDKAFWMQEYADHLVKAYNDHEYVLAIADTSQAYYNGDDANNQTGMKNHALAMRSLNRLKGKPCVVVACHPTKAQSQIGASSEVTPAGGGAFINEVDGNLTLCRETSAAEGDVSTIISLHWYLKLRQPSFDAIKFGLTGATLPWFLDDEGMATHTVVSKHMPTFKAERAVAAAENRCDQILVLLSSDRLPNGGPVTQSSIAAYLAVNQSTVSRAFKDLTREECIKGSRITPKGRLRAKQFMAQGRA